MATKNRVRITKTCGDDSRTHQSMAEACDINVVVARYANGGVLEHVNKKAPRYGDFTGSQGFLEAHIAVEEAIAGFRELPSGVRKACRNDPGTFLAMVETEEGLAILAKAGMNPEHLPGAEDKIEPEVPAKDEGKETEGTSPPV